jgi:hypothetical protein
MENKIDEQNNGQGFAIAGLVIGIFALLLSIIPCIGVSAILLGIIAVVFGAVALTKAKLPESPKGMGIAGITLGGIAIFVAVLWLVFVVGSKSVFKKRFENLIEWTDEFDNIDDTYDDFDDMDSLDDLESALDELEGVTNDTNSEDIVNDTIIEIDN